ncbi:MAG: UvrD/REP helicase [Ilumatobacteraceae bacterium]|nr:UvrD/REP helicase [Ilumatobacteraceae bacterium]
MTAGQLTLGFDPELPDQSERDLAQDQIGRALVVAAGAGAGKTETLIGRLRQALQSGCAPDAIVAITFTERAARDLVDKLRSRLPPALVPTIDQMTVGTIHAFCLSILRRHPLEAGLPPVFSTQDELLAGADAAQRAVRLRHRFFEQVEQLADPQLHEAIDVLVSTNGVYHFDPLVALIDQQWDRFAEARLPDIVGWRTTATAVSQRIAHLAADPVVPDKLRQRLGTVVAQAQQFAQAITMVDALDVVFDVKWGNLGGLDGKPFRDQIKQLVLDAQAAVQHDVLVRVLHVLAPLVLDEARSRYQAGNVSFDDILVLTRRLLGDHPDILARLRLEITHLCVDEFQDTDVVQYDIVRALTRPDAADHGASPVLFAVGDPKQSIYGFRDADVALFEQLRTDPDVTPLQLTTNFRSRPGVLRFVNSVFRSWFGADELRGQVPFSPLDAHVDEGPATATVIGDAIKGTADEVARAQATDIAGVIATAHGSWLCRSTAGPRAARHTDIAVLVRTRADLVSLEPALRRAGIPYVVEGGALLYDTREVRDLIRILTAINDTASPITMVNALRTTVLAVSDVELLQHKRLGGSWLPFVSAEEPVGHPAVLQAMTMMRGWIAARHRTPVPELIAQIARQTSSLAASISDGAHVSTWRRLRLVLDEARWWFEQTGGSLGEYLRWVALRVENEDRSNVTTDETDDDAVHILTVHAAKGLEFPIVIVAGLGRLRPHGDHVRARFHNQADDGVRSVGLKMGTLATVGWDSSGDRVIGELEGARLAYVACTRAEDHLVVCVHRVAGVTATSAAEMSVHLDESHRVPLDLVQPDAVPVPGMTDLDDHIDHPPKRPIEWQVRSSWSATALRQRLDDAATAVTTEVQSDPVEAAIDGPEATVIPSESRPDSVHAKHARAFAALPDQIGRYGTRIGRAVHGVMQMVPLDDPRLDLPQQIARQCETEEVPDRFHPYVARLVDSLLTSDVFDRMVQAHRSGTVRREMYVGAQVTDSAGAQSGVYGIIDAIWMTDAGFVVVDFKTDHVLEPADVLIDRYQVQLQAYEQALRAATGLPVAELLLCVALPDGSPAATITIPGTLAAAGAGAI